MLSVNEKSPVFMTLTFKDENGADLVPTTVDWRLDDIVDGIKTEIVAWTSLSSPASTMNVTVPGSDNDITDETHVSERKAFGVRVDDGLAAEGYAESQYNVLNLHGPSGP